MKVRVFDKGAGRYFKSEVYALVNTGWYERRLVRMPGEHGGSMRFSDYLDREMDGHPVLINTVVPGSHPDWIHRRSERVDARIPGFEQGLPEHTKFFEYIGVPWLFEEKELLCSLLRGESVPVKASPFESRCYTCVEPGWNYVETPGDAEYLLEEACGFHDSLLRELSYVSGAHGNEDGSMCPVDDVRRVTMEFDCQWSPGLELVFEGVTALNLRPAEDNYMSDLYGASLRVTDARVFFADTEDVEEFPPGEGTWISAYSLRWRFR